GRARAQGRRAQGHRRRLRLLSATGGPAGLSADDDLVAGREQGLEHGEREVGRGEQRDAHRSAAAARAGRGPQTETPKALVNSRLKSAAVLPPPMSVPTSFPLLNMRIVGIAVT